MYKKFIVLLLTLLTFSLLAVPATHAEATLSITGITENGDGTVTISWDDPNQNGPYQIGWLEKKSKVYLLDILTTPAWTLNERQTGTSVQLGELMPGQSYWVYVEDSAGNEAHMRCERPDASPFTGPQMTVVCKPRLQNSGGLSAFSTWSAAEIEHAAADADYGMRLELTHGYMSQERTYYLQLTVTDPHGNSAMVNCGDFITGGKHGSKTTFFNFFSLNWYFSSLIDAYGYLPQGAYTLSVFMDGGHVTDIPFEMTE